MAGYPSSSQAAVLASANAWMAEVMSRYDCSHDVYHVNRVTRTALTLARSLSPPPDLFIVELSAILHDLFDKKYNPPPSSSESTGSVNLPNSDSSEVLTYQQFLPFFESVKVEHGIDLISSGQASLISKVVENVSWTTEAKLREEGQWAEWHQSCQELHCVQDADRLDAIGAFGIMRCAAYSSAKNVPLHVPLHVPDQPTKSKDATTDAISHFHDKLLHINERLKTDLGKHLGEKRHQFMLDFLRAVDDECNSRV